jgi:maleate isomerase
MEIKSEKLKIIINCIQVSSDEVLHIEGPTLLKKIPGVLLKLQKLKLKSNKLSKEMYISSKDSISVAASILASDTHNMNSKTSVYGLACTSMSFSLGSDVVDNLIRRVCPNSIISTDMFRSQILAIKTLNVKKICLLTPYIEELSIANSNIIEKFCKGVKIVKRLTLNLETDKLTSAITQKNIEKYVNDVNCIESECIVIGCSAFRSCSDGFISELENKLGKPVITSTQAFLWDMIRKGGIYDKIDGYGILFSEY